MYYTPETLSNLVFEDLRKPKAPNRRRGGRAGDGSRGPSGEWACGREGWAGSGLAEGGEDFLFLFLFLFLSFFF
jgi:hypothetical protein